MNKKKSDRKLLLEHFDEHTPVLVVYGAGARPDWRCVALLRDLTELLIPEVRSGHVNADAKVGLVVAAPIGANLPGCLIEVVQLDDGSESFVELGLAAFARARAGVPSDETDAADQARHADVLSQLTFRAPA